MLGRGDSSWASTVLRGNLGGSVDGQHPLTVPLAFASMSSPTKGGVGFSELLDGELSVHILSLSLSESSVITLPRRLKEATRGLRGRPSWRWVALGAAKMLGRRNRRKSELASSEGRVEVDVTLDEGGRAKSDEEVGRDGRADVLGIAAR
jgi:hypothetical protein